MHSIKCLLLTEYLSLYSINIVFSAFSWIQLAQMWNLPKTSSKNWMRLTQKIPRNGLKRNENGESEKSGYMFNFSVTRMGGTLTNHFLAVEPSCIYDHIVLVILNWIPQFSLINSILDSSYDASLCTFMPTNALWVAVHWEPGVELSTICLWYGGCYSTAGWGFRGQNAKS